MPAPKATAITPELVKNVGCLVKMVFGFIILLIMGYFALVALNPKARQWATSKKGPTPFKAVNQILAIPAMSIGKTNDVVAASNANVKLLDGVIADEEGKKKKSGGATGGTVADPFASATDAAKKALGAAGAGGTATAGAAKSGDEASKGVSPDALIAMQEKLASLPDGQTAPEPVKDTAQVVKEAANPYSFAKPEEKKDVAPTASVAPPDVKLPGGIVVASASPAGAPPATPPFLYWVVNLNISGVFQSSPHRILLNNRTITEGQEVNAALGIVFDHLDLDQKLIVFKDKTGALVTRSY
ncbi:MAG TPA: hypothetical protein VHD61_09960 [Lacunisphaera sp.]|nr:hypothetical protein [Lacunisphaera sp.]